ncbi:MAG: choline kinase family protein [Methylobacter sp.]|jgi:thiamine kinase-like enzyme|nr:choline kinase family protein [Methylobacter sp.]
MIEKTTTQEDTHRYFADDMHNDHVLARKVGGLIAEYDSANVCSEAPTTTERMMQPVERLTGGFSCPSIYKVTLDGKSYVVRVIYGDANKIETEIINFRIAAQSGLAPKVFYGYPDLSAISQYPKELGVICTEFLEASHLSANEPLADENLVLFANGLRTIHSGQKFARSKSIFELAHSYEQNIKVDRPLIVDEAALRLDQLHRELHDTLESKSCHNDLHRQNIMFSKGSVFFIDWEVSGLGDPYFDLATLEVFNVLEGHQQQTFLNAYLERTPSIEERHKYRQMKQVAEIYYGLCLISLSQLEHYPVSPEIAPGEALRKCGLDMLHSV